MTGNDLRALIAQHAGVETGIVDRVLVALRDSVLLGLRQNEDVELPGLGIFHRPVRSDATPSFQMTVDVVHPDLNAPHHLFNGQDERSTAHEAIENFMRSGSTFDEAFGVDPERIEGAVTHGQIEDESKRVSTSFLPSPDIAQRVISNLKSLASG